MPSERRLHPLSFLFGIGARIKELALPIVVLLFGANRTGLGWQVWFLWLLVPYTILAILRAVTFRYRFDEHELVIRTGAISRNERHIPYSRIQNVDGVQNVFHRLLKVVDVKVQTAGGNEPEATMSVLPVAAFEEMRRRVLEGRHQAVVTATDDASAGVEPEPSGRTRTLLSLSTRDLLTYGFVEGRGMVVIGALFGLYWEFGLADSFMPSFPDFIEDKILNDEKASPRPRGGGVFRTLLAAVYTRAEHLFTSLIVAALAVVAIVVILRLLSMLWAMIRLYGFTLTREGEDLRTSYGIITRIEATIPLRRIQTLTLLEGPLHRLTGRMSARVDTAGGEAGKNAPPDRHWLAPIVVRRDLPALLHDVLPVLSLEAIEWRPVHPGAVRRIRKEWFVLSALAQIPLAIWMGWWGMTSLLLLIPFAFLNARRSAAALGWAVTDELVAFKSGWIWRQTTIAPYARVQAVKLRESPFDRRSRMASVKVDTAGAGDLSHRVAIPYLDRAVAEHLWRTLTREAASRSFRWS
jgi:putative membrane protein